MIKYIFLACVPQHMNLETIAQATYTAASYAGIAAIAGYAGVFIAQKHIALPYFKRICKEYDDAKARAEELLRDVDAGRVDHYDSTVQEALRSWEDCETAAWNAPHRIIRSGAIVAGVSAAAIAYAIPGAQELLANHNAATLALGAVGSLVVPAFLSFEAVDALNQSGNETGAVSRLLSIPFGAVLGAGTYAAANIAYAVQHYF